MKNIKGKNSRNRQQKLAANFDWSKKVYKVIREEVRKKAIEFP